MSIFRVDPDNPFHGPHQGKPVSKAGPPADTADIAMILVHGRGATAESILLFADEFDRDDIHYRAIQADRYTWYPQSFLAPKEQNEPGISSGMQAVFDQITFLNEAGISTDHILLLGFSQGACLTTEFAARHPQKFGGIIGLSGGLIGPEVDPSNYKGSLDQTPVFLGCSDIDPHIPKERVDETEHIFEKLQGEVTKRIYKSMGHTVNQDEINYIKQMLNDLNSVQKDG